MAEKYGQNRSRMNGLPFISHYQTIPLSQWLFKFICIRLNEYPLNHKDYPVVKACMIRTIFKIKINEAQTTASNEHVLLFVNTPIILVLQVKKIKAIKGSGKVKLSTI